MEYVVWVEQPDGQTGGSVRAEFDGPLTVGSTVEYGGRQCIVTDVDEAERPPHVWLKLRPE